MFIHLFIHLFFFFEGGGGKSVLLLTWSTVWSDYLGSWQLLKHHTHPNVTPYFNLLFETHIKMHKKQGAKLWCNKMKFQLIRQQNKVENGFDLTGKLWNWNFGCCICCYATQILHTHCTVHFLGTLISPLNVSHIWTEQFKKTWIKFDMIGTLFENASASMLIKSF